MAFPISIFHSPLKHSPCVHVVHKTHLQEIIVHNPGWTVLWCAILWTLYKCTYEIEVNAKIMMQIKFIIIPCTNISHKQFFGPLSWCEGVFMLPQVLQKRLNYVVMDSDKNHDLSNRIPKSGLLNLYCWLLINNNNNWLLKQSTMCVFFKPWDMHSFSKVHKATFSVIF